MAVAAVGEEAEEERDKAILHKPSDVLGTIMSSICASNLIPWAVEESSRIGPSPKVFYNLQGNIATYRHCQARSNELSI